MLEAIAQLFKILLKGAYEWFSRQRWHVQVLVVAAVLLCATAWYARNTLIPIGRVLTAKGRGIPLSATSRDSLLHLTSTARAAVTVTMSDLARVDFGIVDSVADQLEFDPWSVAQCTVAIADVAGTPLPLLGEFLSLTRGPECCAWRRFRKRPGPVHVPTTSWAILALCDARIRIDDCTVQELLEVQRKQGAWPTYPCTSDDFVSTYSTAMAMLALKRALEANAITDGKLRTAASEALDRAKAWLLATRLEGCARWPNYPGLSRTAGECLSNSGLVVHTLNVVDPGIADSINRLWLGTLPPVPLMSDFEAANVNVELSGGGAEADSTRYLKYPCALLATVDAYSSGSVAEKATALSWIEKALRAETAAVLPHNWFVAEVLCALSNLERRSQ